MWPLDYHSRLAQWVNLRRQVQAMLLPAGLHEINQWWYQCPWRPYYLHWDDRQQWPGPWELLADNVFCDLARALGMLYTIRLIATYNDCEIRLVETNLGNLVLVDQAKYVMNWRPNTVVNIPSNSLAVQRTLESPVLDQLIR